MRVRADDPACYLIELEDLTGPDPPEPVREHREPLERLARWAREFLWNPHPDLGRQGAVCPFAQTSMERGQFFMTLVADRHVDRDGTRRLVLSYLDWFHELEPRSGPAAQFKTILILFPLLPVDQAPDVVDGVQADLKYDFVDRGLMLGQFHELSDEPGLWNDDFRPLRAPVPLLGIRDMVPTDFPFLRHESALLAAYLRRFAEQIPPRLYDDVAEAAAALGLERPGGARADEPAPSSSGSEP